MQVHFVARENGPERLVIEAEVPFERQGGDEERLRDRLMEALRRTFRPECLNRIDEIVTFHSLGKAEIEKVVEIQLEDLQTDGETFTFRREAPAAVAS